MKSDSIRISKFLSYILRHRPDAIGISLDNEGWVNIKDIIKGARKHGKQINKEDIFVAVAENDKQRFSLSDDNLRIRARQGHSFSVNLGLKSVEPPKILYHGTVWRFVNSIALKGLIKGKRQYVHLSSNIKTAIKVGGRRGKPLVLEVDSETMYKDGYLFYLSENKVWLTDNVPFAYILVLMFLKKDLTEKDIKE